MNQSIQQLRAALYDANVRNLQTILLRLYIQNHLQCLLVEGHESIETCQVEVVFDEVFRDFCKVFMAGQGAEPGDPG